MSQQEQNPGKPLPLASSPPVTRTASPVYSATELDRAFRQCEILSNVMEYVFRPADHSADEIGHPLAIIISQDCDLHWDFEGRRAGNTELPMTHLLLCRARTGPDGEDQDQGK